jgi:RNA polymerase-binding transcription factor
MTADLERREVLRRMLAERREDVRGRLRALREDMPAAAGHVKDPEEQSADDFAVGLDVAILERHAQTLQKIDAAITRLDAGTYGTCGACEEPIPEARLRALPFADFCVGCQERWERLQGTEPRALGPGL